MTISFAMAVQGGESGFASTDAKPKKKREGTRRADASFDNDMRRNGKSTNTLSWIAALLGFEASPSVDGQPFKPKRGAS